MTVKELDKVAATYIDNTDDINIIVALARIEVTEKATSALSRIDFLSKANQQIKQIIGCE